MMSLGVGAARLLGKQAMKLQPKVKVTQVSTLIEHADTFMRQHMQETAQNLGRSPNTNHSVGEKFSQMMRNGYEPEHLVVTPNEVILDLEAVERDAFRTALMEAAHKG